MDSLNKAFDFLEDDSTLVKGVKKGTTKKNNPNYERVKRGNRWVYVRKHGMSAAENEKLRKNEKEADDDKEYHVEKQLELMEDALAAFKTDKMLPSFQNLHHKLDEFRTHIFMNGTEHLYSNDRQDMIDEMRAIMREHESNIIHDICGGDQRNLEDPKNLPAYRNEINKMKNKIYKLAEKYTRDKLDASPKLSSFKPFKEESNS